MSKRLELIASYITPGIGFIDVGTDHGYLPAMLAQRGYPGAVFASDINAQPLEASKKTAREYGVSDKIQFLLCDGLEKCPPDMVDTIVIAGMGGDTIVGILDRAEWCMDSRYKLILQPMTKSEVLRYWLVYNGFQITAESLVKENGNIYQVIFASFDGAVRRCSDAMLYTGDPQLIDDRELFSELVLRLIERFAKSVRGLESADDKSLCARRSIYRGILEELERYDCK